MISWHRRSDYPCDTHVLIHHSRSRPHWLDQCLASLESEPTNVLLVDDPTDSVGYARALAMREGNAPLLSFVDDDDWVMPGAFAACFAPLDADPTLVGTYTQFADVDADTGTLLRPAYRKEAWNPRKQLRRPFEVLHVHVYRRAHAMPHLDGLARWPTLEESWLMGQVAQYGNWLHVPFDGYRKRLHGFGAGARVMTPDGQRLLRQLTMELSPILIQHPAGKPPSVMDRAKGAAVALIDYADRKDYGCAGCKDKRASVRAKLTR